MNGFGHIGSPSTNAKAILLLKGALAPATKIRAKPFSLKYVGDAPGRPPPKQVAAKKRWPASTKS
jgi:hypothetical protein